MIKVNKEERIKLANIYNTEGKAKLYELLREKYLINNPSQAFASMKKAPYLFYDEKLDRFGVKDLETNEAKIFLNIDELCSNGQKNPASKPVQKNHTSHKSMDAIIQELIGDRLLILSQYVSLDTTEKILRLDETSLKSNGYQLILH